MEEFVKEKMDLSEFENINHISLNIIEILEHKKTSNWRFCILYKTRYRRFINMANVKLLGFNYLILMCTFFSLKLLLILN